MRTFFGITVFIMLGFAASAASAASITVTAVDWSSLTINTTGTVHLSLSGHIVENTARAFDTNFNSLAVTTSRLGPVSVAVAGTGSATAGSASGPYALASAEFGLLDATSKQGDYYSVSGAGTVTASVDYSLSLDEPVSSGFDMNFGAANLLVMFFGLTGSPLQSVTAVDTRNLVSFPGSGTQTLNGTLVATADIVNTIGISMIAITGDVQSTAIASIVTSPVPAPAAVWLLGSALLGLTGLRRAQR